MSDSDCWDDQSQGALKALAVRAAQIRLTVDMPEERELIDEYKLLAATLNNLSTCLLKSDVVLPELQSLLTNDHTSSLEYLSIYDNLHIPDTVNGLVRFKEQLSTLRRQTIDQKWVGLLSMVRDHQRLPLNTLITGSMIDRSYLILSLSGDEKLLFDKLIHLAVLGQQREEYIRMICF